MRKITKLLTLALAALMIMSVMPVSAAFTDVSVEDEALTEAVELLSTLGVAKGTTETTFGPEELVTRQQMAAFVYRLMKAGRSSEGGVNTTAFTDLEDSTFFNMVSWANNAGIIKGTSATTFNPKGNITLQDAYVMVVRALGYEKDGALVYPHGYVDQAEALGLDEDIPSSVNYTDNLNRGQVAIILANAFYADMNEKTVKYDWVYDKLDAQGNPVAGANATYVAKEETTTIAEKIFGVVEEVLVVTGTTHYSLGATNPASYDEKDGGVEFVYGARYAADDTVRTTPAVAAAEYEVIKDLKLEGAADDYFMAEITLFVQKDDKDPSKDKVLASKSNLVKKTVKADKVVLETSSKSDDEYYVGGNDQNDKVLTGYAEFDGIKAYLDIKAAPYSVTKTYDFAKSLKFIDLTKVSYDEDGNNTFVYSNKNVATNKATYFDMADDATMNGTAVVAYDVLTNAFAGDFPAVYRNGLYEADVYDVNGDNYADYIFVKNYDFFQINDKKGAKFTTAGLTSKDGAPAIYTGEAVIEGEYTSGDFVLGYIAKDSSNAWMPYIKVAEKVEAIESKVTLKSGADYTVTLADGTVLNYEYASAKFTTKWTAQPNAAGLAIGAKLKAYIKDGVLLFSDAKNTTQFDINANYTMLTGGTFTGGANGGTIHEIFDTTTDKTSYYVKAIIDGEEKNIKLAGYANIINNNTLTEVKITSTNAATTVYNALNGKIFTYKVTDEGYVLTEVEYTANTAGAFTDPSNEYAVAVNANTADIKVLSGNIFTEDETAGDNLANITKFNLKDYTKIIIKSVDTKNSTVGNTVYKYTVYTAATLPKFTKTTFTNVKAVFVNNTASTATEDLAILYADANTFNSALSEDFYKVIAAVERADENDKSEYAYNVLNVKTGEILSGLLEYNPGSNPISVNSYVIVNDNNEVVKVTTETATTYVPNTTDGKLITGYSYVDYDAASNFLTLKNGNGTTDTINYVLADDVTVIIYNAFDKYGMAEKDALDTETNVYELLKGVNNDYNAATTEKTLYVDFVAEQDKNNTDIVIVNTIILAAR